MKIRNLNPYAAAIVPILLWSALAAFLNLFSEGASALAIASYAIIVGATCFFLREKVIRRQSFADIAATHFNFGTFKLSVISGIALFVHYHALYFCLVSVFAIEATIINYLWPIILYFGSTTLMREFKLASSFFDDIWIAVAFMGIVFLILGTGFEEASMLEGEGRQILFLSLTSALSAAIYFVFAQKVKLTMAPEASFYLGPTSVAALLSVGFLLFSGIPAPTTDYSLAIGLFLGVTNVFFANTLWTIALTDSKRHTFASIAYFIPVLSAAMLVAFGFSNPDSKTLIGILLVVCANILLHINAGTVDSLYANLALIALFLGCCVFIDANVAPSSSEYLGYTLTLYALFAAFMLERVWRRQVSEKQSANTYAAALKSYLSKAADNRRDACRSTIAAYEEMYYADFATAPKTAQHLEVTIEQLNLSRDETERLEDTAEDWVRTKAPAISTAEIILMCLLAFFIVLQAIFARGSGLMEDLGASALATAVVFALFVICNSNERIERSDSHFQLARALMAKRIKAGPSSDLLQQTPEGQPTLRKDQVALEIFTRIAFGVVIVFELFLLAGVTDLVVATAV